MEVPKEGATGGTGSAGGEGSSLPPLDSTFRLSRFKRDGSKCHLPEHFSSMLHLL